MDFNYKYALTYYGYKIFEFNTKEELKNFMNESNVPYEIMYDTYGNGDKYSYLSLGDNYKIYKIEEYKTFIM